MLGLFHADDAALLCCLCCVYRLQRLLLQLLCRTSSLTSLDSIAQDVGVLLHGRRPPPDTVHQVKGIWVHHEEFVHFDPKHLHKGVHNAGDTSKAITAEALNDLVDTSDPNDWLLAGSGPAHEWRPLWVEPSRYRGVLLSAEMDDANDPPPP